MQRYTIHKQNRYDIQFTVTPRQIVKERRTQTASMLYIYKISRAVTLHPHFRILS